MPETTDTDLSIMNEVLLLERLTEARKNEDDFHYTIEDIVRDLPSDDKSLGLVVVILQFIENNPALDYGSPGALVFFVEKFYRRGYESRLLDSLSRHPVSQTLTMLNRLINGTKGIEDRDRLISVVENVIKHPSADTPTRHLAQHYIKRYNGKEIEI